MTDAEKALHAFYERVSYLVSTSFRKPGVEDLLRTDKDRLYDIAYAVHVYEKATERPQTPSDIAEEIPE